MNLFEFWWCKHILALVGLDFIVYVGFLEKPEDALSAGFLEPRLSAFLFGFRDQARAGTGIGFGLYCIGRFPFIDPKTLSAVPRTVA